MILGTDFTLDESITDTLSRRAQLSHIHIVRGGKPGSLAQVIKCRHTLIPHKLRRKPVPLLHPPLRPAGNIIIGMRLPPQNGHPQRPRLRRRLRFPQHFDKDGFRLLPILICLPVPGNYHHLPNVGILRKRHCFRILQGDDILYLHLRADVPPYAQPRSILRPHQRQHRSHPPFLFGSVAHPQDDKPPGGVGTMRRRRRQQRALPRLDELLLRLRELVIPQTVPRKRRVHNKQIRRRQRRRLPQRIRVLPN